MRWMNLATEKTKIYLVSDANPISLRMTSFSPWPSYTYCCQEYQVTVVMSEAVLRSNLENSPNAEDSAEMIASHFPYYPRISDHDCEVS